jgi:5-methylcytosine-specific restriction endonuclease McrA
MLDENYEIDHIHPLARGGSNPVQNLQALCRACHVHKTDRQRVPRVNPD